MLRSIVGLQCNHPNACDDGLDSSFDRGGVDAIERTDRTFDGHVDKRFYPIEAKMSVLYVALPVALLLGGSALIACLLCIRSGQYDDLETPAVKLLNDELKQ